jgi:glucosyl-dolichyl phosphate glucuronosyltransferase
MRFSIIVCTFNRVALLNNCLESLVLQDLPESHYEVLVIDNNSTDATRRSVLETCKERRNVRYVFEPNQGLSHARNRGITEARGEYIGYFDDDAKAPSDWLAVAMRVVDSDQPDIFGGPYYAFYNCPKPRWFKDDYQSFCLGIEPRSLQDNEFLCGTNIFFEANIIRKLGGFDPKLGMTGQSLGYGEETRAIILARERFPDIRIQYYPALYVFHLVAPQKMSLNSYARQCFINGRFSWDVFKNGKSPGASSILKVIFLNCFFLLDLVRGVVFRNRQAYRYPQNYFYECSSKLLYRIGRAYEELIRYLRSSRGN